MNTEDRIKQARDKAKKSAKEIFKENPADIKKELENETLLGNPGTLVRLDDKSE